MAERKANVYATLVKLQDEVSQITEITEILKDAENIKDSKTFVEEIKKEFGVSIHEIKTSSSERGILINHFLSFLLNSTSQNGLKRLIAWANISTSAVNTCNRYRIYTFARWSCSQPIKTT